MKKLVPYACIVVALLGGLAFAVLMRRSAGAGTLAEIATKP